MRQRTLVISEEVARPLRKSDFDHKNVLSVMFPRFDPGTSGWGFFRNCGETVPGVSQTPLAMLRRMGRLREGIPRAGRRSGGNGARFSK